MALVKDNEMDRTQLRLIRDQMKERNFQATISTLLENLDRQLLLVLRTKYAYLTLLRLRDITNTTSSNLIRSIIKDLGETGTVDRFLVMAHYSIRGLRSIEPQQSSPSFLSSFYRSFLSFMLFFLIFVLTTHG